VFTPRSISPIFGSDSRNLHPLPRKDTARMITTGSISRPRLPTPFSYRFRTRTMIHSFASHIINWTCTKYSIVSTLESLVAFLHATCKPSFVQHHKKRNLGGVIKYEIAFSYDFSCVPAVFGIAVTCLGPLLRHKEAHRAPAARKISWKKTSQTRFRID
jgi:hypothetical protein